MAAAPRDSCLSDEEALRGAVLWALLVDHQAWIHRRVESIRILDHTTARRSVSLDLTVPALDILGADSSLALPALPLTFLKKEVLKRFDLWRDEKVGIPTLTKEQNGRAVGDALVQTVEGWVQDELRETLALPEKMEREIRAVVEEAPEAAAQALWRWHAKADPSSGDADQRRWAAVVENAAILAAASALADNFVLLAVTDAQPGRRQLLKLAYDEGLNLTGGSRLLTSTGWRVEQLSFEAPAVALTASYHLELLAVDDLENVRAEMSFAAVEGVTPSSEPPDGRPIGPLTADVHFNFARVDPAYQGTVDVSLRAERRGFVTGATLTATVVALLLLGGIFRLDEVSAATESQVTSALLLLAPAVFGAFTIRPGEHRLASRMLVGVRALLVANLGAAIFAVAVIAAGYKHTTLLWLWLFSLLVAAVTAAGLGLPLLRAPSAPQSHAAAHRQVFVEHVSLAVADIRRSRLFYEAALAPLGAFAHQVGRRTVVGPPGAHDMSLVDGRQPDSSLQLSFIAPSRAQVDAFHAAALAAGGTEVQRPQVGTEAGQTRYRALVRDPDGNMVVVSTYGP